LLRPHYGRHSFPTRRASDLIGVRQLFEIIDAPSAEAGDEDKPRLVMSHGRVEFRDVWFAYRDKEPVLRGLSLVAEAGQMSALVGDRKSTRLNSSHVKISYAV